MATIGELRLLANSDAAHLNYYHSMISESVVPDILDEGINALIGAGPIKGIMHAMKGYISNAKKLINEAKPLMKTDKRKAKAKLKEAVAELKKGRKEAEKIPPDGILAWGLIGGVFGAMTGVLTTIAPVAGMIGYVGSMVGIMSGVNRVSMDAQKYNAKHGIKIGVADVWSDENVTWTKKSFLLEYDKLIKECEDLIKSIK